jgi:hypothetical protein
MNPKSLCLSHQSYFLIPTAGHTTHLLESGQLPVNKDKEKFYIQISV